MLTLTKYAFLILALVLAILALNFGRSKIILTGSQNVSLAFYRYTIQETDITVEYPSNVLARITPTSAEATMMQNTGLIMQYKIDYTDASLADVGWTAYDSNNQPAILDDCTIYCRYYGAASTSGGVEFTGPETTKQVKMPKIKTLDGTTLILTKAGTADTTDNYVKASDYYGEAIDYQGNTSDTKTYRLFYVDFDNKYKDGEGTIYLKADWTEDTIKLSEQIENYTPNLNAKTKFVNMNPKWAEANSTDIARNLETNEITAVTLDASNEIASAWLTDTNVWKNYANGTENKTGNEANIYTTGDGSSNYTINYAIGAPSADMLLDSYNEKSGKHYSVRIYGPGYQYSDENGENYANYQADVFNEQSMYSSSTSNRWLASPASSYSNNESVCSVNGNHLNNPGYNHDFAIDTIVSIKPTTINSVGNYIELNSSNGIVKGYTTLSSALSSVTNGNTIKPLKDITETTAPTLASGKTASLDLNNKTITLNNVKLTNNGTLTIKGAGTLTTSSNVHLIENSGTLNLVETATLNDEGTTGNCVYNYATGRTYINGGNFTGTYGIFCESTGSVEMVNGSINTRMHCIHIYSGNVVIRNGTITTSAGDAIWVSSSGTVQMLGGTVTGYTNGIVGWSSDSSVNNSSITVTGGTVTCNNGPGISSKGNITIGTDDGNVSSTIPSITGKTTGVGISTDSKLYFYDGVIIGKYGNDSSIRATTIPASGCDVFKTTSNGNEIAILASANYLVHDGANVVNTYNTLKEAFDAATDQSKQYGVIALKDVTDASTANPTVASGQKVTFDTNGKTVTMAKSLTNAGTLTISGAGNVTTASAIDLITNSGTLNVTNTGEISNTNAGAFNTINNTGTVNKTGSGTISSATSEYAIRNGTINVSAGKI